MGRKQRPHLQVLRLPGNRRSLGRLCPRRQTHRLPQSRRRRAGRKDRLHLAGLARPRELPGRGSQDARGRGAGRRRRTAVRRAAADPGVLSAGGGDGAGSKFVVLTCETLWETRSNILYNNYVLPVARPIWEFTTSSTLAHTPSTSHSTSCVQPCLYQDLNSSSPSGSNESKSTLLCPVRIANT